jgi:hypothetical protein
MPSSRFNAGCRGRACAGMHGGAIAEEQSRDDAERKRRREARERCAGERHAGVRKGKQRNDAVGDPGLERMLGAHQQALAAIAIMPGERHREADRDACERRMHARLQYAHPGQQAWSARLSGVVEINNRPIGSSPNSRERVTNLTNTNTGQMRGRAESCLRR